jgi:hypothetical protein
MPGWVWIPISLLFVAVDTATGNAIPPPTYVLLVGPAAWFSGHKAAVPMALLLPFARLATLEAGNPQIGPARFTISVFVLVLIAVLIGRLAQHEREMRARIRTLESLLPMCMFCKSIRTADKQWQRLEAYMSDAGTGVTHGICPTCAAKEGWSD